MNRQHLQSPSPDWHRDVSAAAQRGYNFKHQYYHARRDRELRQRRAIAATLLLLTALAVLVWPLCREAQPWVQEFRP